MHRRARRSTQPLGGKKMCPIESPDSVSAETCLFSLQPKGDWPPIKAEPLACARQSHGYEVLTAPFFIQGLSVGDIITLQRNSSGEVTAWSHVTKSKRSTVWLLGPHSTELTNELEKLHRAGCSIHHYPGEPLTVIDVPARVSADSLEDGIGRFRVIQVAIAYPSWRHAAP
jgi:hypothetical protein